MLQRLMTTLTVLVIAVSVSLAAEKRSPLKDLKQLKAEGQADVKSPDEWSIRIEDNTDAWFCYPGVAGYKYFEMKIPRDVALAAVNYEGSFAFGWRNGKEIDKETYQAEMAYVWFSAK
jgi:hypothetical protein